MSIDPQFSRRFSPLVVAFLALVAHARATAAAVESGVGVRFAAGYDSNPLLVMDDGPSGGFAQLDFDARIDVKPAPAVSFFLRSQGFTRAHEGSVSNANAWGGEVRTGVTLPQLGTATRRLSIALGARASTRRDTFVDRATGQVYQFALPTNPPSSAPIPDRFDCDSRGVFLNARLRTSARLLVSFDGRIDDADYVDDYDGVASLGALDNRAVTLEPGVYLKLGDPVSLGVSIAFSSLDYDSQPALDSDGAPVSGTTRAYGSLEYRLVVAVAPGERWDARLGYRRMGREDTYAGYYSYEAATSFVSFHRRIGAKDAVEFQLVQSKLDYERAVVPDATDGSRRGSDSLGLTGRFEKALGASRLRWFAEAGFQRVDSRDPVLAYDRDWALTGFEFRR